MATLIGNLVEQHPKLPIFLANTVAGKIIHMIDRGIVSPVFSREKTVQEIQSWPKSVKMTAEWVLYLLGGAIRTMPDKKHPIAIIMQEALVETLTHAGMKIAEIPEKEQEEIITMALPEMRHELTEKIKTDHKFRDLLGSIFGTSKEWNTALQEANGFLSQTSEKTKARREARKTRGWRRFFV